MSSASTAARRADAAAAGLPRALSALQEALEVGGERLDPDAVAAARVVLARARERFRDGAAADASVVALAGATGSGKSSLFNALAGLEVSRVGVRRPTTSAPTACTWGDVPESLLDWLEVPRRHRTERVSVLDADTEAPLSGLVLLDLPDHDSTAVSHRLQVDRLVGLVDLLVWVVDPQKYADAALHAGYLRHLVDHQGVVLVVLNQVDTLTPEEADACEADLRRLLDADGLTRVRLLRASARTGVGVPALRDLLTGIVQARTAATQRTEADLAHAVSRLRAGVAPTEPDPARAPGADQLVDALARAAGVPTVLDAVRASEVRRGRASTGWPFTRWARRLRPDPLRRLHLAERQEGGRAGRAARDEEVEEALRRLQRSSLPDPTPAQRAQVATAARAVAGAAAAELPQRWADAVRAAAAPAVDDLADALDQAVQSVDLTSPPPRWYALVSALQLLLAAAVVVGAVWLGAMGLLAWLQLPQPPVPRVGADPFDVPVPTLLLLGGALAGIALAALCAPLVRRRARRRRRRVEARLREAIGAVARERLLDAVAAVLAQHRRTRELLDAAAPR
ncbi:GTPase [Quadrisphaera sp. DSM 44207]|uniref:GTPase n=1 Tax=Quadrisphaera sp. DSM 44207 TaxID=1881057 RepID=UPI00088277CD|nr:GTPase [Quadrisphaera sp. DSM 44207]SDQ06490.1 50S ribosome-binding GTPase [Quadrisphaera sp. DSM 44207]